MYHPFLVCFFLKARIHLLAVSSLSDLFLPLNQDQDHRSFFKMPIIGPSDTIQKSGKNIKLPGFHIHAVHYQRVFIPFFLKTGLFFYKDI